MRILYLAKHNSGGNDDEGAVAYALVKLGHEVVLLHEKRGHWAYTYNDKVDMLLFHKWSDLPSLAKVTVPVVCFYFDLVDFPQDNTLWARCQQRIKWMVQTIPLVDLMFCTDGDWVEKDTTGKLAWLTQGADERVVGLGVQPLYPQGTPMGDMLNAPILFTGNATGGRDRRTFVQDMRATYGDRFHHVSSGVYGRDLAELIARSKIVVAPDGPITNRYWSNRVYNVLGFGGFLLHPWCEELSKQYQGADEILYYKSRGQLHELIKNCLDLPEYRNRIAEMGLERTRREHLYRHRCETLVNTVKERLGI